MKSIRAIPALALLAFGAAAGVSHAASEERIHKNFQVEPGGTLIVDVDFGSIDIVTSATAGIVLDAVRSVKGADQAAEETYLKEHPVAIEQGDGKLTIRSHAKTSLFGRKKENFQNEGKYTLRIPERFDVQLNTAGGSIHVRNLTGNAKAATSGGGLQFAKIKGAIEGTTAGGGIETTDCDGGIRITTSGGDVVVRGGSGSVRGICSGGTVRIKGFKGSAKAVSSGGGIEIENVGGAIEAESSGGGINAVLASPAPGEISFSSSGGGVNLSLPANAAFNLDAASSGGSAKCDLPIAPRSEKSDISLKGAVNGGGAAVKLRASGGGIRVIKL